MRPLARLPALAFLDLRDGGEDAVPASLAWGSGARAEIFSGLSGIGDRTVTRFSKLSRNRGFGEQLGRGEKATAIQGRILLAGAGSLRKDPASAVTRGGSRRIPHSSTK